jgi:hypothetical protein
MIAKICQRAIQWQKDGKSTLFDGIEVVVGFKPFMQGAKALAYFIYA